MYQFNLKTQVLKTLHKFTDTDDGCQPEAGLVQGTDGNFYGTTTSGGANVNNLGTVFKITTAGKLTQLYSFDTTHGSEPSAALVQGSDGNFYGTTVEGGTFGSGVVFKITASGKLTVLHDFGSIANDGGTPAAGLLQATDGNFYGVTESGGTKASGIIFRVGSTGGKSYSVRHNFNSATDGSTPEVTLLQHTTGLLYGLSYVGGEYNFGTFYSLDEGLGAFANLVSTSGKVKDTIEILGQGLSGTAAVSFNGTAAKYIVPKGIDTYLAATVPPGATTGSVTVTTPGGTLTSSKIFRVTPSLTSFDSPSGAVGTSVVITGVSLTQTTAVAFGGVLSNFTANSDAQVTATVPTGAKTGKVAITTTGGSATSATTFTVTP